MSHAGSSGEEITLRSIERTVAQLAREGPSIAFARACFDRAVCLMSLGEELEAGRQLDDLLALLDELSGPAARELRLRTLARRVHFHQRDGEGAGPAIRDLRDAIGLLESSEREALPEDLRELEVELWIHLGRLLVMAGREQGAEALEHAVSLASGLGTQRGWLFLLRARRELAVACATVDPEQGLTELTRAEELTRDREVPEVEADLLRATRAEMLANAGRLKEALRVLSDWPGPAPTWALAQQAAVLDLAGEQEAAHRLGMHLIERQSRELDPRDLEACLRLSDALLDNVPRATNEEERGALANRVLRLLADFPSLPPPALRALARAQEVVARAVQEPEDACEVLEERVRLLEGLVRETRADPDRLELSRAYLQLGDALMHMGAPREARRYYTWGIEELRRWPPEHPFALEVLPQAHSALGHALAAQAMWLAARRELDEAGRLLSSRTDPATLASFGDIFVFRAVCHVNAGDPHGAVRVLRREIARLLGVLFRGGQEREAAPFLTDLVVNLYLLQAEVLFEHLDDVDEALNSYDQALNLRELDGRQPAALVSILGAKGAVLNEAGRAAEALPLLRRCLEMFDGDVDDAPLTERAQAHVQLAAGLSGVGKPRDALGEIEAAQALLEEARTESGKLRQRGIRSQLYLERGQALRLVGHPLLAVDELSRAIKLCHKLIDAETDEDDDHHEEEAVYDAELRLPLALLQRARCWAEAGDDHAREATGDLREARRRYTALLDGEARPAHQRRLEEVVSLQEELERRG